MPVIRDRFHLLVGRKFRPIGHRFRVVSVPEPLLAGLKLPTKFHCSPSPHISATSAWATGDGVIHHRGESFFKVLMPTFSVLPVSKNLFLTNKRDSGV